MMSVWDIVLIVVGVILGTLVLYAPVIYLVCKANGCDIRDWIRRL